MARLRLMALSAIIFCGHASAQIAPRDRVTYTTFRPGNWDIYIEDGPGAPLRQLTSDPDLDYDPVVSPDGRWLVFCSERRGNPDLFTSDLVNGGEPRLLLDSEAMEDQASISPDGKTIAFVSTASGNADIYTLPFDPGRTLTFQDARNLTRTPSGEFRPAFSPDGTKLAFSSDRDSNVQAISPIVRLRDGDIYVMDLAHGEVARLTSVPGWDGSPAWSPDGKTIAYYHGAPRTATTWKETRTQVWTMSPDGTSPTLLTPDETNALSPSFLPGGRIVYSRKAREGGWELVSVDIDGKGSRVESSAGGMDLWKPAPVGSGSAVVMHGISASKESAEAKLGSSPGPDLGLGPFFAGNASRVRVLPDREIEFYAIRYFTAIANPKRDLAVLIVPPGPAVMALARLNGTERRKLLEFDQDGGSFSSASWSRDGEWIAFTRGKALRSNGEADVWKIRADGSQLENMTASMRGNQSFPSFSPDGRQIVFRSAVEGKFNLYIMSADGTNVRPIATSAADAIFPTFSPVNRQIAFLSNRDTPDAPMLYDIYLLDLADDDSVHSLRRITDNRVQEGHIAFAHDGKWLIFTSERGGISDEEPLVQSVIFAPQMYGEMYACNLLSGDVIRLTHNKWEEGVPSWEAGLR